MLLKQLALAASAAAFLVVPDVTEQEEEMYNALPMDANNDFIPADAFGHTLNLPCASCKGKDTHLNMDFAVEEGTRLTLNGYELYPSADPWHGDLTAAVIRGNGKKKDQLLGYSLAVGPEAYDEAQSLEIINVGLHIIEVGGRFIEGIPTVNVKLIKAPTNEILIGDVIVQDAGRVECTDVWCILSETWDSVRQGIKSCGKMVKGHHGHGGNVKAEGKRPHHGRPAHHEHGHDWVQLLKNVAVSIVLPVLAGIAAGVGVAGFLVAVFSFAAVILRLRRRKCSRARRAAHCRAAHAAFKARSDEPAAEEEKTGLMEAQGDEEDFPEPPPQYADGQE